jgi:hypothetical protein
MNRVKREDGAIFVHIIVAIVALLMISGIVIDQGVMMVSRTEAQAAADAGALAGAAAFAYDNDDRSDDGPAKTAAYNFARMTGIWGEQADVTDPTAGDATDVKFYDDDPASFPATCVNDNCIRVDVYRNQERANGIPLVGFRALGLTQGVRATATARAAAANGSKCLKPWLIPDAFNDVNGDGDFDLGTDQYNAPGYTIDDIGTTVTLNPAGPKDALAPSMFFQVDVNNYFDDIVGCELTKAIGQTIDTAPGLSAGLTKNGVNELTKDGPVTVVIGMFSPIEFANADRSSGHYDLTIVNMMSFRIEGMSGKALYGTLVAGPGDIIEGAPTPEDNASFIKVVQLIR